MAAQISQNPPGEASGAEMAIDADDLSVEFGHGRAIQTHLVDLKIHESRPRQSGGIQQA